MTFGHAVFLRRLVLLAVLTIASSSPAQDKSPIPSDEAQAKALELIKEVYGQKWDAAKTSAQKQALATKLLQKAGESTDDTNRYVLLEVARDVAAQAGNAELAFKAIEAMSSRYDVDAYTLKGAALSQATKSASSTQSVAIVKLSSDLIDQAVAKDDFVAAKYLGGLALDAARKGRDGQLVKQAVARNKEVNEIAEAYSDIQDAVERLKIAPVDPEANLPVGKYYCFIKGNWDHGLPMLALGSDERLKELAVKELRGVSSAEEQVALGDGWWNLAQECDDPGREAVLRRAALWYTAARYRLPSGLMRDKVAARLQDIDKPEESTPPQPKPVVGRWIAILDSPEALKDWRTWEGKPAFVDGWWKLDNAGMRHNVLAKDMMIRARVQVGSAKFWAVILRSHYRFAFEQQGRSMTISKWMPNERRSAVLKHVELPQRLSGAVQMEFSAIGDTLTAYINGQRVMQARDKTYAQGDSALQSHEGRSLFRDVRLKVLKY